MRHPLSKIEEIPDKGSLLVDFFGRSVHVYKRHGKPAAVANVCVHFGGPLNYNPEQGKFVCPWHNSEFGEDGECLKGPAPSAAKLMFLSTRIEGDTLYYVWGE